MSHKIFKYSFFIGLAVLLLCTVFFAVTMYNQVEQCLFRELEIEASYIAAGLENSGEEYLDNIPDGQRVTWVASDGSVLFDNRADASAMDNHIDRPEIAMALRQGSGSSRHLSGTMTNATLYYAQKLSDGSVIRVSAAADDLGAMFVELLSPVIWAVLLVLLLCCILASRLAKQITGPINALDLDKASDNMPYRELMPLARRVDEQNRIIARQMTQLRAKNRELQVITENMSEGLILVDNKGAILFSNHSGLATVNECDGELKSINRATCLPQVCEGLDSALAGNRFESIVLREGRAIEFIISPVHSDGQVNGAVILSLDVSEREQREELRREFSANVSHELKTPLTSISGFAELMKEGLVPADKMQEFASDIYSECRRLMSLIDDIIRLSQIDECETLPECENIDLYALAADVIRSLSPLAEKAEVSMSLEGGSAFVFGNRRILDEMLYNLSENAIKYNKKGGSVTVGVKKTEDSLVLSVKDQGIGIPPEHQKRIFERFYRVDKSHSKQIGGTGLGLSIVRHGAKFHNAKISLNSEAGKGSEFIIVFPARRNENDNI